MKLSEARQRYIGKKFRIKHAERGTRYPYVIEGSEGVCTHIESYWFEFKGERKHYFRFRIDCPDLCDKWFSAKEIEPVEKN